MSVPKKLKASFYQKPTEDLAKSLLGKRLVRIWRGRRHSGIIVETEAYLGPRDPACHTWKNRRTDRVSAMYLPGGHSYVYMIYGMHYCFNVVAEGDGEAVLIRALAPEAGQILERADGPGRLCRALKITKAQNGCSLSGETIFIEQSGRSPANEEIGAAPRIGVEYAGEAALWPLRFYWRGNPHVSRKELGWKTKSPRTKPFGLTT